MSRWCDVCKIGRGRLLIFIRVEYMRESPCLGLDLAVCHGCDVCKVGRRRLLIFIRVEYMRESRCLGLDLAVCHVCVTYARLAVRDS